jgi:hypothetical protein
MDELPLQKVLYFEPCVPEIGTAYLLGVACAEGRTVGKERLREIYCDTYELTGADVPQDTSAATRHWELPDYDLRRAMHRAQVLCGTSTRWEAKNSTEWQDNSRDWAWEISHEDTNGMRELDTISQQADLVSAVDSWSVGGEDGRDEVSCRRAPRMRPRY